MHDWGSFYHRHPLVIAHRGASAHAPENTLAAFRLAVRQNAAAIELDAKLSADGIVVVIHDQTLERTTDGSGLVGAHTWDELKNLDAGSFYDPSFKEEGIPTLEQVFEAVGQDIYINVELTNYATPKDALPEKVTALIARHGLEARVFCSSFTPFTLRRMQRLMPDLPLGLLAGRGWTGKLARGWLGRLFPHHSLNPEHRDVTAQLVAKAHRRGLKVFPYTVNLAEDMARLFSLGVDGIFTDDPPLALRVLEDYLSKMG
jgi:glycerophosphoryl diester phosphodiesterase